MDDELQVSKKHTATSTPRGSPLVPHLHVFNQARQEATIYLFQCGSMGVYGESLYLPLDFTVKLKLLSKLQSSQKKPLLEEKN